MRRTTVLTVALIVISSLLLANCKKARPTLEEFVERRNRILREHAAFDKAYIPALLSTSQEKSEESQKAMTLLKEAWEIFANKYYPRVPKDLKFRRSLDRVQKAIRTADHIVSSGGDLKDAHESLEEIRFILMDLRGSRFASSRWRVRSPGGGTEYFVISYNYYIDYLTEFHEPMEAIVLTAKGKTPETLTDADIEKIKEQLAEASKLLTTIENAEFEQSIFGFSDEKTQTMRSYVSQEAESLNKLREALKDKGKGEIIQASIGIKPEFVKLFTMFGDFESLK